MWIETLPLTGRAVGAQKFIRQQWRMWIETKKTVKVPMLEGEFIRQQWRMWIETKRPTTGFTTACTIHSPAMANVD